MQKTIEIFVGKILKDLLLTLVVDIIDFICQKKLLSIQNNVNTIQISR